MSVSIHVVVSKPFDENSYIVHAEGQTEAVVIDPGFEPEPIFAYLREHGLSLVAILNTHGHADHIASNQAMKSAYPDAPLIIGTNEAELLTNPNANVSGLFGVPLTSPEADQFVNEGDVLELAGLRWHVLDIPGHSPGHVVFVLHDESPTRVFGGDVLFADSIGRTDFPYGNIQQLLDGIRAKLWPLPDDTIVYPGHYQPTTVGHEKATNPYVRGDS